MSGAPGWAARLGRRRHRRRAGAPSGGGEGAGQGWGDPDLTATTDIAGLDEWGAGGGWVPATGWLPELVRVTPRHVGVGRDWSATLAVTGWPHEVAPGWLEPLLTYPARLDVCLHIDPVPTEIASRQLRRQLARLESARYHDATTGRLGDPHADAAAADAAELTARLARADTRLHRVGLYLTLHSTDLDELDDHLGAARALVSSMLADARPLTYRALRGRITTLPLGIDSVGQRRIMDTDAAATTVPFISADLPSPDPTTVAVPSGVLYGHNLASGGLVIHDRFAGPNYNSVLLATSGAGKSYLTKLEVLRSLYRGVEVIVIDPEDEYARLAHAVGGAHIRLGAPDTRINPLDLPHHTPTPHSPTSTDPNTNPIPDQLSGSAGPSSLSVVADRDVLTRRALYLHTVLGVLLGELAPTERVLVDRAIHTTYAHAGINLNPATWTRPAPLLADLAAVLQGMGDPGALDLGMRLEPYVAGSFSTMFAGPTTTHPTGHLVVFSLKDLPEELRGVGTLLALDATWRTVADPARRRKRIVVVDEAWLLLQQPAGAAFLLRLAKSARKHWCGLALITQDAGDVLSTELGRGVVSNAAAHVLMRTASQAADAITREFALSTAVRGYLTSAATGQALLITSDGHQIPFAAAASAAEDQLITTDPAQLADLAHDTTAHHTTGHRNTGHPAAADTGPGAPVPTPVDVAGPLRVATSRTSHTEPADHAADGPDPL